MFILIHFVGENFSIKYHDMNDVVDFLVLKHSYEASMKVSFAYKILYFLRNIF